MKGGGLLIVSKIITMKGGKQVLVFVLAFFGFHLIKKGA